MSPPQELLQDESFAPLTREQLTTDLTHLGVRAGGVLMVHVRLSAFGWVVGGIDSVVYAIRDALGPEGTILAFCGWEDNPYHVALWPPGWQRAYDSLPPFDPTVSSARRDFGRFPERLRTWPGAWRSAHPEVSFAALGPKAHWLLDAQQDQDPWGPDSPLGRLVAVDGQVLLLGAPINRLTLCHHAESIVDLPGKYYREYRMPVRSGQRVEWRSYRTIDTFYGVLPYHEREDLAITSPVGTMAQQAINAGAGRSQSVGVGTAWLFESRPTVRAVVDWLERTFSYA